MSDYNGWTNYETWNANLWMTNEEPSYRAIVREARNGGISAEKCRQLFLIFFELGTPDMADDPSRAIAEIDWDELAEAWSDMAA